MDDEGSLQYSFAAIVNGTRAPLTDFQTVAQVEATLALSMEDREGRTLVVAIARNTAGCETVSGPPVAVTLTALTLGSVSEAVLGNATSAPGEERMKSEVSVAHRVVPRIVVREPRRPLHRLLPPRSLPERCAPGPMHPDVVQM